MTAPPPPRPRLARAVLGVALGVVLAAAAAGLGCRGRQSETTLVLAPTSVVTVEEQYAMVAADSLRVRVEPSVRSEVLAYLRRGEIVEVLEQGASEQRIGDNTSYWYRINYQAVTGWVFGAHLEMLDRSAGAE